MKQNLYRMYAMALLQGMVFYGPIATLYRQASGLSIFEIALIESISMGLTLLLELPWGYLADRIGYRRTMIVCSGLFFVSKLVFWRADGFCGFLLERVLLSVVGAGMSGVEESVLYLSCPEDQAQKVFGRYQNCQQAGLLFATGVYGLWLGEDYRLAAFFTVLSYGAAAGLSLGLNEVKEGAGRTSSLASAGKILKQTLTNRRLLLLILALALVEVTHQMITVFTSQMKYAETGMSSGEMAAAYLVMTVSGLAGGCSARLTARFGARRLGCVLFAGAAAGCVWLARTKCAPAAVLAVVLLRVSFCLLKPLQDALQNDCIRTGDRATALSMAGLLMDVLAVFAEAAFGRLADVDLGMSMMFGGLLCVLGAGLYWFSWRTTE